jgi:ATP-dependent Clp protease protease subunit
MSSSTLDSFNKTTNGLYLPNNVATPNIVEERPQNVAIMSVFDRLMRDRKIFYIGEVGDGACAVITAQLLFLDSISNDEITMHIMSPGGSVYAGMAVIDTMNFIKSDVRTVCIGYGASMGYMLTICGTKGKRMALKHARLMQHQPMGGAQGQASDIAITYKEIEKLKQELYTIISEKTGQPYEKIEKDCDRDYWMTAEEAKIYGAIDEVI